MGTGSTTSQTRLPQYLEDAVKQNLALAGSVGQVGYVPYAGPDVAAYTPMQEAALGNMGQGMRAFGMEAPRNPMAGMPDVVTSSNGARGYSSAPIYQDALRELQARNPGQYAALTSFFMNPQTGQPGSYFAQAPAATAPIAPTPGRSGGMSAPPSFAPPGASGGYAGLGDMFNGGGPGASGQTFSGGLGSNTLNTLGFRPLGSR